MNIYAIKDRLLEYFMQPFAGPEDKAVLSSIARIVNDQQSTDPVAQAPHHYEVWRLGYVDETGHIHSEREFLGDCSTFLRTDSNHRGATPGDPTRQPLRGPTPGINAAPGGSASGGDTNQRPTPIQAQTEDRQGAKTAAGPSPTTGLGNN